MMESRQRTTTEGPRCQADRGWRHKARIVGLAVVSLLLLTACGGTETQPASEERETPDSAKADNSPSEAATELASEEAQGPWTFVDDRGEEITLDAPPKVIVAQEDSAAALWYFGVQVTGVFGGAPLEGNPQLRGVDVSGMESVGEVWGEINLEKLASLGPDLIVTTMYPPVEPLWGFGDAEQQSKAAEFAPIIALDATLPAASTIQRFQQLAGALGADLEAPRVVEAEDRFRQAVAAFKDAVAAKPGIQMLALAGAADEAYVAEPAAFPDLQEYIRWGLEVIVPETSDGFFETVSWENIDKYPADLIYHDARSYWLDLASMKEKPTFEQLPAVQAGQTAPWLVGSSTSYAQFTENIKSLTAAIEQAEDIVE